MCTYFLTAIGILMGILITNVYKKNFLPGMGELLRIIVYSLLVRYLFSFLPFSTISNLVFMCDPAVNSIGLADQAIDLTENLDSLSLIELRRFTVALDDKPKALTDKLSFFENPV